MTDSSLTLSWPIRVVAILGVGLALAAWRRDVLWLPPFQDQAVGYWAEADYLAETGFNYIRLLREEPHYMDNVSGARSYFYSVCPSAVALLMTFVHDPATTFLLVHFASFLLGAALVVAVFDSLAPAIGRARALLVAALFGLLNTTLVQMEVMSMDVPLAWAMFASCRHAARREYGRAYAWGMLAFFVKATGQLAIIAIVALSVCEWVKGLFAKSNPKTAGIPVILAGTALLTFQWTIIALFDTTLAYRLDDIWPTFMKPPSAIPLLTPEIGVMLLAIAGAILLQSRDILGWPRQLVVGVAKQQEGNCRRHEAIATFDRLCWLSAFIVAAILVSSWRYFYSPRYIFCALPFLTLLWGRYLFQGRWTPIGLVGSTAVIAFSLINGDGRYLPSIEKVGAMTFLRTPGLTPRSNAFLERSREYLADHYSSLEAARVIEAEAGDRAIFAAVPYRVYLKRPRLGYVTRKLNVQDASLFPLAIINFLRLEPTKLSDAPLFVWFGHARITLPPREGETLYRDALSPPLQVYVRTPPTGESSRSDSLATWYIDSTWSVTWLAARVQDRLDYLLSNGRSSRAQWEWEQLRDLDPAAYRRLLPMLHSLSADAQVE